MFWKKQENALARDIGLLTLRLTFGGLMAGHGAQKLFGAFGGYGLEGTAGWLGSLGLKPPKFWAFAAGAGEFGSGVLTALGFLTPLGAVASFGPMLTAWVKVHAGKPIWATSGGAELPLVNLAIATTLTLSDPGRFSIDEVLDIEIPGWLIGLTAAGVAGGVVATLLAQPEVAEPSEPEVNVAGGELQAGQEASGEGADTALGLQELEVGG